MTRALLFAKERGNIMADPERQYQTLLRNLEKRIKRIELNRFEIEGEPRDFDRASGSALCSKCQLELRDHLHVGDGDIIDCNGRILHL